MAGLPIVVRTYWSEHSERTVLPTGLSLKPIPPHDSASSPAETRDTEGEPAAVPPGVPGDPTWPGLVLSEQGLYFGAGQ